MRRAQAGRTENGSQTQGSRGVMGAEGVGA